MTAVDVFGSFADAGQLTLLAAPPAAGPPVFGVPVTLNLDASGKLHTGTVTAAGPGTWSFKLKKAAAPDYRHLTADDAQELMLIFHYTMS